jgi:hypothetical protein
MLYSQTYSTPVCAAVHTLLVCHHTSTTCHKGAQAPNNTSQQQASQDARLFLKTAQSRQSFLLDVGLTRPSIPTQVLVQPMRTIHMLYRVDKKHTGLALRQSPMHAYQLTTPLGRQDPSTQTLGSNPEKGPHRLLLMPNGNQCS